MFLKVSLALLFVLPGITAQTAPAMEIKAIVERFDAAQAKVDTLQAPFTLTISRAMLKTPTFTKGTVFLQGSDFAHFNFAPPEDLILHLTPKALTSFSPAAKEGELLKIGHFKNHNRKFLGLGQKLAYLSDYFTITLEATKEGGGSHLLKLIPRTLSMKKRMQSISIWVDTESYLPRQILWVERGGDTWFLELGHLSLNQPIPATVKDFKVPPGIRLRPEFSFFATRKK